MKKNFESNAEYDLITTLNLTTETGFIGRCVQDVITKPSRKFARLQGERNFVEWYCTPEPGCDLVQTLDPLDNNEFKCNKIKKNRPDDFIEELKHISSCIKNNEIFLNSPISLSKGLEVMRIIAAAELSNQTGREVAIDYNHIIPTKSLVLV